MSEQPATRQKTTRQHRVTTFFSVTALTVIACALRFWRVGSWSFDSDETFTLRDSLHLQLTNPRPLFYFLNHYVVGSFHSLDEFGLRILPATFGALAVPLLYLMGRRLMGSRSAFFGALLLAFSPLHVYYSQFARYWSLVFLLSAVYPYCLYLGIRDRNRSALALGAVLGMVATLAHPTTVLLLGSVGLWFALMYVRGDNWQQLWNRRAVRQGVLVGVMLAAVIVVRFTPMLRMWVHSHQGRENTEFLLHLPSQPGLKQLVFLTSYLESLTLPLVVIGLLGIYLLWQKHDRPLALFLTCVLVFPVAFLILVSFIAPISTFYLVPSIPTLFYGAGVFLDRLAELEWELRPRWLLPAAVASMVIATGAPTLVSQYRDGRRYDFRSMARWLDGQRGPGDIIFSDQPKALAYYLPGTEVQYLRGDPGPLLNALHQLRGAGRDEALWVISPAPAHAFRTNPQLGSLREWLYTNCQLRNTIGVGRVDFRQYHLQAFRCPAALPGAGAAASTATVAPTHSE